MGVTLKIEYDNRMNTYIPGNVVSGTVQLSLDKSVTCQGLLFEAESFAHVVLKNVKSESSDSKKLSTKEVFFNHSSNLWGDNSSSQIVSPGQHHFNFRFALPPNVPPTFIAKTGNITHVCHATLKLHRSWRRDPVVSAPFTVESNLDLNDEALAKKSINEVAEKKISSLFSKSGILSLKVNINRSGYIPGENIFINAEVINTSSLIITHTKAEIIQDTSFKVADVIKFTQNVVASKILEFENNKPNMWTNETLRVPNLVSTGLNNCSIIDIQYRFKFKILSKKKKSELEASVPLVIGSIALRQVEESPISAGSQQLKSDMNALNLSSVDESDNQPSPFDDETAAGGDNTPSAPPCDKLRSGGDHDEPPPSYEESITFHTN